MPNRNYNRIAKFLELGAKEEVLEITLSYPQVEKILGTELPQSAYNYSAWWHPNDHPHAQTWANKGWNVDWSMSKLGSYINFKKV